MLAEIESAIASQLETSLKDSGVKTEAFPDTPQSNPRVTPKGRVMVGYQGSTFDTTAEEPLSLWMEMSFGIVVQVANIRSHTGALPILDKIRESLTGFRPVGGTSRAMRPKSEAFDDYDEKTGIWYYQAVYVFGIPYPSEILDLLPPTGAISDIAVGLWRSFIGEVGNQDESTLDTDELLIDGNP